MRFGLGGGQEQTRRSAPTGWGSRSLIFLGSRKNYRKAEKGDFKVELTAFCRCDKKLFAEGWKFTGNHV